MQIWNRLVGRFCRDDIFLVLIILKKNIIID